MQCASPLKQSQRPGLVLPNRVLDRVLDGGAEVGVEVGPVGTVEGAGCGHLGSRGPRWLERCDLIASLQVSLLIPGAPVHLRHGCDVQCHVVWLVAVFMWESESVGNERALDPAIGNVGEMPLHFFGGRVPGELVSCVDEGLQRSRVDEAYGREVEDNGAEDRSGVGRVGVLAAARAGVIPWAVLEDS